MKENKLVDWNECLELNISRRITPDKGKAKSLIETARDRIKYKIRELNEKTANYLFEDYYSSLLELIHALTILEGYKINNHVCLGFFLRDILKKEDLFKIFDDCRFKRNSLIYYGKRMDFATSKKTIQNCKILIKEIELLLKIQKQ